MAGGIHDAAGGDGDIDAASHGFRQGGAVGGALMALFKVIASGIGPVPGAGFALFLGEGGNFVFFLIGIAVSVAVAMVVTHILKFEDVKDE